MGVMAAVGYMAAETDRQRAGRGVRRGVATGWGGAEGGRGHG